MSTSFFLAVLLPIFVITVTMAVFANRREDSGKRRKYMMLAFVGVLVALGLSTAVFFKVKAPESAGDDFIGNFEDCIRAGTPIMESYPRRCINGDQVFIEYIGNEIEKADLIRIDSPRPNGMVESPLTITGEARGYWYFEASFPVILTDWDGLIIAEHYAEAQSDWMTEEFVPFSVVLEFESPYNEGDPEFMKRGTLILQKDNPSGLPENDDALEIPIEFKQQDN